MDYNLLQQLTSSPSLSLLSGVTHSSDYHIWQRNEFASNGVREFAEKGEAWTLMKEVEAAGERIQSVYGILSAPAVVGGTGQMNTEFEVFARHSYVSQSAPGLLQSESGNVVYQRPFSCRVILYEKVMPSFAEPWHLKCCQSQLVVRSGIVFPSLHMQL